MKTFYQNQYVTYSIVQGILYVHYKHMQVICLNAAQTIVKDQLRLQDDVSLPVLYNIDGILHADYEARNYLAHSGTLLTKAIALLCSNLVHEYMGHYFIEVCLPTVPTRVFTDEQEALLFLENYK